MSNVSKRVKWFALIYVATSLWWGPAAEAAFHLEYQPGVEQKGIAPALVDQTAPITGLLTQAPAAPPSAWRASGVSASIPVRFVAPAAPQRCGGDLPTCAIMECENKGAITGKNPSSSASGKWQIVDGTWGGYGGYAHAQDAPEAVQDAKARELWAESHGHWEQCF